MRISKVVCLGIVLGMALVTGCSDSERRTSGDGGTGGVDFGGVDLGGVGTDGGGGGGCGALPVCGGACTDTRFDPMNCGGCGTICGVGEVCNSGACASGCGVGTEACGGRCVDTDVDPANCGSCGGACNTAIGEVCSAGACVVRCPGGTTLCGASCVDITSNRDNCGMCDNPCAGGEACVTGTCGMRPSVDADSDTISDFDEAATIMRDTDGDGMPDSMDTDSDGDGLTDSAEAGDTDVMTEPVDSDGDGRPNFRDLDSDNDGLSDTRETALGTSTTAADSDGDGESDAVEVAGGSNPLDAASTVGAGGDFTFDLEPGGMARTDVLTFEPRIQRADVFFLVDTTGSMGGTITGLRTSLASLVTSIRAEIPDTAFGVGRHDDFPVAGYGSSFSGDVPFGLIQRVTTNTTDITAGVAGLTLHGGSDGPESQIESLYQAATGAGFRSAAGVAWTPAFVGATGFDATRGHGMIGGTGFRRDALPIVILATDITFHRKWGDNTRTADALTWCGSTMGSGCDEYAMTDFGAAADQQPKTVAATLTALRGIGARVFGLAVDGGSATSDQRVELATFAVGTGAYVDPVAGMCDTGVSGALRAPDLIDPDGAAGPLPARNLCPLVYSTRSDGTGVGTGIVNAIRNLTSFVSFRTIHTEARDNPATVIDETRFFVRGIPVMYDTVTCPTAPMFADRLRGSPPVVGVDGTLDSFTGVAPGCRVTFQIVARNDGFATATCTDQIFNVDVIVVGDDTVESDRRTVVVRVPGVRSLCTL